MMQGDAAAIAVYDNHPAAEDAVRMLNDAGFDMTKLSIVGKDFRADERVVGFYNIRERINYWGGTGALWGGLWGLLVGTAFFAVPGIGPALVGGPLVAVIASGLESALVIGGLSAIGAALYSVGIPKDSVVRYEIALRADKFLVVVNGTSDEVARASAVLKASSAASIDQHGGLQPAAAA